MNIPNMNTGTWWTDFWLFSLAVVGSLIAETALALLRKRKIAHALERRDS